MIGVEIMKNLININTKGMNLKQVLEQFYSDNRFYSRFPVVFGWGIDFAYCGVEIPDEEFSVRLFMAGDNHDGTARIEIFDNAKKYLKTKKDSRPGVKQTESPRPYLTI